MFYRVVMQGRTVGGADLATVKREFVRVTGLPVRVADGMFGGMPKIVRRKAEQGDAERIAATLRAIGAAATVEREIGSVDPDDETDEGIQLIAAPMGHGPPTVAPGMVPMDTAPSKPRKAWVRDLREKWPVVIGTLAVVGAASYFGPELSGWVSTFRAAPDVAASRASVREASAEATASATTFNVTLLHGPWRCVDQRTGLGVYWNYAPDGGLAFHGEVLTDRPAPSSTGAAIVWNVDGIKLLHKHAQGEIDAFRIAALSLQRLRYLGDRGLEIECRRP